MSVNFANNLQSSQVYFGANPSPNTIKLGKKLCDDIKTSGIFLKSIIDSRLPEQRGKITVDTVHNALGQIDKIGKREDFIKLFQKYSIEEITDNLLSRYLDREKLGEKPAVAYEAAKQKLLSAVKPEKELSYTAALAHLLSQQTGGPIAIKTTVS